jgi:tol-pal system protein YbgF
MASLGLAIVVSGPVQVHAQVESQNDALMNLVLQVQQLQDEVRMLRGQLEEQSYELENLKQRQRDQYLDLDQRLGEMANRAPAGVAAGAAIGASRPGASANDPGANATAPPAVGPSAGGEATLDGADVPDVTDRSGAPSSVTALSAPATATAATVASPVEQQAAYDAAFQSLKELRYADAARAFQDFVDTYPQSDLAGNAQYWLGESYYVTRNYEIALEAFETLLRDYPDSTKRGDGLLKIGFTHYELDQFDRARAALEQVQQEFPDSTLSRLAESRLRSMRLDGQF